MNRWKLGRSCFRKVPISGIGIMNYQGSDNNAKLILELLPQLKSSYNDKLQKALENVISK